MSAPQKNILLRGVVIYLLAAFFLFYEMALQVSPSIMTRALMSDLGINAAGLGIMAGFYFYSYTLVQIPVGILYDYVGPRILISLTLLVCAAGALFFGVSDTIIGASAGRFFMGVGSAFAFVGVLVVAARWFSPRYFALLVGIAQMLAALGALGGELPLALAVNHFGWRAITNWMALIGLIAAAISWFVIRNAPPQTGPTPQKLSRPPLKPGLMKLLANPQTWVIGLYAFSAWAPVAVFAALWGVPYLMAYYGISNAHAALICSMIWVGLMVASPLLGWLSDRLQRRRALLQLCSFLGLLSSIVILFVPHIPIALMFSLLFVFGVAASGQILTFALVRDINPPAIVATAIGFNNMAVVLGGALFQPLVGIVLHWVWNGQLVNDVPFYSAGEYRIALIIIPICFFIGLVSSRFFIKETFCHAKT